MNRIDKKLEEEGKLLSIYFTAGYPNLNDTKDIIIINVPHLILHYYSIAIGSEK